MKNNKLTRKRVAAIARKKLAETVNETNDVAGHLRDGTEVLKSKESKAKSRRWTFEADVTITMPPPKNEDGTTKKDEATGKDLPPVTLPQRTLRLEGTSYCTVREVKDDLVQHEARLRQNGQMFKLAKINVRAIPHETVSNETLRQLEGYRDMSMILDRALGLAIEEAASVVLGKALGSQFVEKAAVEKTDDNPGSPAVTNQTIKEDFYRRALVLLSPREPAKEAPAEGAIVLTDAAKEEKKPFVPEIVEIQKAPISAEL
jgi:hypothetical protein